MAGKGTPDMLTDGIDHVATITNDGDRLKEFYTDVFENPATIDIRRSPNRHLAFGAGPHRCVGSHLARLELAIALEEWHRRIPDYHIVDPDRIVTKGGGVVGIQRLELAWDSR